MELADLRHGAWYRLEGYPGLERPVDFQADLCWGRDFSVLIQVAVPAGEGAAPSARKLLLETVAVADLLPHLTAIERPEGRVDTVDPEERLAAMAARAVRKRLDLDHMLGKLHLQIAQEEDDAPGHDL